MRDDPHGRIVGGMSAMTTDLTDLVRQSLGEPGAEIAEQRVEQIGNGAGEIRALCTGGLHRVSGTTTTGRPWSFVTKAIHSLKHSAMLEQIPESIRPAAIAGFPWRADLDVYLDPPPLPERMRLPRLHRVDDLGDDRLVIWLEDVPTAPARWDLDRYRSAARLLGRLAAMNPAGGPSASLRHFYEGPLLMGMFPLLRDPATWRHPLFAAHVEDSLKAGLLDLIDQAADLYDRVNGISHSLGHGDACPQNLLVPAEGPADFVAIDWSWPGPLPLGFDLGQLLIGLPQAGLVDPAELPAIHAAILHAYAAEVDAPLAEVRFGYLASLVLRSAWTALPVEYLTHPLTPQVHRVFRGRTALARFIVNLVEGA
jgi:hypothetical protein